MAKIAKYVVTSGEGLEPGPRSKISYVAVPVSTTPKMIHWLFLLFVFTFPFEATALGSHSIAKLVGLLFFALYFLHYNPVFHNRSFPPLPNAMWWFLGYTALYI